MELNFDSVKRNCTHTFSANEIRTFCDCSRKRYYASRDLLAVRATKATPALSIGTAVHKWLQAMYTRASDLLQERNSDFSIEQCEAAVDEIRATIDVDGFLSELDDDNKKIFMCITENYIGTIAEDLTKYTVVGCEVDFQLNDWPVVDTMYHGQIDMIVLDREEQSIKFFEHKTCKDFRPEIYNRFDIQLHIYDTYGRVYSQDMDLAWGGMILNEIKKAKTERGYAHHRMYYKYSFKEHDDFFKWLTRKTRMAIDSVHEPCNNYMTCKMCDYAPICLKYGYEVPATHEEIVDAFVDEETGEVMFKYDPRETDEEE